MYRETRAMLEQHGFMSVVDEEKLRAAVLAQSGMPVDVTAGGSRGGYAPAPSVRDAGAGTEIHEAAPPAQGTGSAPVGRPSAERMAPTEVMVPSRATVDAARRPLNDDAR
jgi:hypothetical protein